MPYLEKEKYSESLVEKLLDRINSKSKKNLEYFLLLKKLVFSKLLF
jgi:hypothetical protein